MGLFSLLFLAAALAMDAFSVAVTDGMLIKDIRAADAIKIALFFGVFQFIMPCIGSFVSGLAADYIASFDHWIVFVLLSFLGIKMIAETRSEHEIPKNPLKNSVLFMMAVATSVDALAAGITLTAVGSPVLTSSAVIGVTAFLFSFAGVFIGRKFGDVLGNKAEFLGGVILIFIGFKTLIEHLFGI